MLGGAVGCHSWRSHHATPEEASPHRLGQQAGQQAGGEGDTDRLRAVRRVSGEEVLAVLDDVRRHLRAVGERPWPPAWFGAGEGSADDIAARSEDLLRDGFGRSA